MSCWAMILANYDYHVRYRPGNSNVNADGLSRANQIPADDMDTAPSVFMVLSTLAYPDLPVCLDPIAASAAPQLPATSIPAVHEVIGPC